MAMLTETETRKVANWIADSACEAVSKYSDAELATIWPYYLGMWRLLTFMTDMSSRCVFSLICDRAEEKIVTFHFCLGR